MKFSTKLRNKLFYDLVGSVLLVLIWQSLTMIGLHFNHNIVYKQITPFNTWFALKELVVESFFYEHVWESLSRILYALFFSLLIGFPIALVYGGVATFRKIFYLPFQFVRMISPLAWMPIAVVIYNTWNGAIIFLLIMATIWPIIFNTVNGINKIDIEWIYIAKSFNANLAKLIWYVVLPAISQELLTGLRIALGISWVLIVPAEYLGVTSGLGYAINDARDTLDYSRLMALILSIGVIGYLLDSSLQKISEKYQWNKN